MNSRRSLISGYSISFLDLLCCAFGGVTILMVVFLQSSGALTSRSDVEAPPAARDLELPFSGEGLLIHLECVTSANSTGSREPPRIAWELNYQKPENQEIVIHRSGEIKNFPSWIDKGGASREWAATSALLIVPDARKIPSGRCWLVIYLADRGGVPDYTDIILRWTIKASGRHPRVPREEALSKGAEWCKSPISIDIPKS